jgi:hypothetical protein
MRTYFEVPIGLQGKHCGGRYDLPAAQLTASLCIQYMLHFTDDARPGVGLKAATQRKGAHLCTGHLDEAPILTTASTLELVPFPILSGEYLNGTLHTYRFPSPTYPDAGIREADHVANLDGPGDEPPAAVAPSAPLEPARLPSHRQRHRAHRA